MVEKEKAVDNLQSLLGELARGNVRLEELDVTNLNYLKPRVRRWLKEGIDFPLDEVLTETEERMVKFYSGLNGTDRMHNLAETAAFLGWSPKSENLMGSILRYSWVKLKRREIVGSEAIETLKVSGLIYDRLVKKGVVEIGDVFRLPEDKIREVCGNEWGLLILKEAMEKRGIDWNPEVKFPLFVIRRKGY